MSVSAVPKVIKEQMIENSILEEHSSKIYPMPLADMSKLAEVLKLKLAIQNNSDQEARFSTVKMQKILFEHLVQYQNNHSKFTITDQYQNVLTENKVKQLKSMASEAISEN
jgi:hypothetical protein